MKRVLIYLLCFLFILPVFTKDTFAKIGVGVNTGKIYVDEELQAGMIYQLPSITVINTGDESAVYETSIAYHQDQKEITPDENWFIFSPQKFELEAGGTQLVNIKINLPFKIEPGNYFAYLEAHPLPTIKQGGTVLGIAAASKLYFTVTPASFFLGIYYKVITFWKVYSPWTQRIAIAVLVIFTFFLFKKFFNIKIDFKKPEKLEESEKPRKKNNSSPKNKKDE